MSEARDLAQAHIRAFNERAWNRAAEIYAPDLITVEPAATAAGSADSSSSRLAPREKDTSEVVSRLAISAPRLGVLSVIRSALLIGPKSAGASATPQGE